MAKPEALLELQQKVVKKVTDSLAKYAQLAQDLHSSVDNAKKHEFVCYVANMDACVKSYDDFRPRLFATERRIAKVFRDCAKKCMQPAPKLMQLGTFRVETMEEMQTYQAAAQCFGHCTDLVVPDFKTMQTAVQENRVALERKFQI